MKKEVSLVIAKGNAINNKSNFHRYVGIATVNVIAINPDKATMEQMYSTPENPVTFDKDPVYYSVDENGVKTARINFILQVNEQMHPNVNLKTPLSYFIKDAVRYNRDNTKVQLINAFGETAWVPVEDAKSGKLQDNMKWFDTTGVRPAYVGEEELVRFIKCLCNIPVKSYTRNGVIVNIPNIADAYCQLDHIKDYFNGNIDELRTVVAAWPNNTLRILFGVKTSADNKQYQDVFIQMPLKGSARNNDALIAAVRENKDMGRYPNTDFGEEPYEFKEYVVQPTNLETTVNEDAGTPGNDGPYAATSGWWQN